MHQAAVCLAVLISVQCLAFGHAQTNFSCADVETLSSESEWDDVRLERRSFVRTQDASHPQGSEPGVRDAQHNLHLGDCEVGNYTEYYNFTECIYPEYYGGIKTYQTTVYFSNQDKIMCYNVVDTYFNSASVDLGGYVFLERGGVGYDFIVFRFESQANMGMVFDIDIVYMRDPVAITTEETTTVETTTVETTPEETTPEGTTTTQETTTTTPDTGDAVAVGKFRGHWLMLCCIVLFCELFM